MRTAVEIDQSNLPVAVFHRSGGKAWTHAADKATRDACAACKEGKA